MDPQKQGNLPTVGTEKRNILNRLFSKDELAQPRPRGSSGHRANGINVAGKGLKPSKKRERQNRRQGRAVARARR